MQTITYDPATHVLVPRYPTDEWVRVFFGRPDVMGSYMFMGDFGNIAYFYGKALETISAPPQSNCTEKSYDSIPPNSTELESSSSNNSRNCAPTLTAAQCDEFRRHPGSFNAMVQAIHDAGWKAHVASQSNPVELHQIDAFRSPWQPIDTAPKDGTPLLLFARAKTAAASISMFGWYLDGMGWISQALCGQDIVDIVPSHWMPVPPPPEEQS